ncbi:MAG: M23 family metallopeptidase [bacterium]|nr:M23 family metallopeptidase [bacterium]
MALSREKIIKILIVILLSAILFLVSAAALSNRVEAAYGLNPDVRQVKTADNPAVYYLDHQRGLKKAYLSEAAYLSYGNKWPDVKIVSREDLDKWPDLRLVKAPDSNKVYYLRDKVKAWIETEQQFIESGFSWSEIAVISKTDLDEYKPVDFSGAMIAGEPDQTLIGGGENAGGLLRIAEAPFDLSSAYIPTGSRGNIVAAFVFKAAEQDAKIKTLTFTRQGVSSDQVIDAAYLADQAGNVIGEKDGLVNHRLFLNLSARSIIIPAGQDRVYYLIADIKPKSNVLGQTLKFGLLKAADIGYDSAINGAFPLVGPEFRLIDGVSNLGRLEASPLTLKLNGSEAFIGLTNQAVAAFRLAEVSGNEDILIREITLTNIGSARAGDLKNLTLTASNGQVIAKTQVMADQKITFSFGRWLFLSKGHFIDLTLKADIVNGEGRDLKFIILSRQDLSAIGLDSRYEVIAANGDQLAGNANKFLIKRAPLFLTVSNLKDSERLAYSDQEDALLASFELRNNTSDVALKSLTLKVITSGLTPALDDSLRAFDGQTGKELGLAGGGQVDNEFSEIKINGFTAAKGKTVKLLLKSHIPNTAISGDTYQIFVKSVNYNIADDNILHTDNVDLAALKIQVITPALYFYSGQIKAGDLAVAGKNQVILGAFKLEAVKEEDLSITALTIRGAEGFAAVNYANGFSNLALYRGGSRISEVIAEPNADSYAFTKINASLVAGGTIDVLVKADLAKNADGTVKLIMESGRAQARKSKISADVNNNGIASPAVEITHTNLKVEAVSGGSAARGQKNNKIASFNFTNNSAEKVRLNRAIIDSFGFMGNLSNQNGFSNLRFAFTDDKGRLKQAGSRLSRPVADVNEISLGGFSLEPGQSLILDLLLDADDTAVGGDIGLFIREIKAQGLTSSISAVVNGAPTASAAFKVGSASNSGNNGNDGNGNNNGNSGNQAVNLIRPVSGQINFGFHDVKYPYRDLAGEHTGVDIYTAQGTPVKAAGSGLVTEAFAGNDSQASNITIDHGNGLITRYVHLSRLDVKAGDSVKQGDAIGLSGGTPGTPGAGSLTNGPHLHFEILLNGALVDPEKYL